MLLDLNYFKTLALSCQIEISDLETLLLRANPAAEMMQIPKVIESVPSGADNAEETWGIIVHNCDVSHLFQAFTKNSFHKLVNVV